MPRSDMAQWQLCTKTAFVVYLFIVSSETRTTPGGVPSNDYTSDLAAETAVNSVVTFDGNRLGGELANSGGTALIERTVATTVGQIAPNSSVLHVTRASAAPSSVIGVAMTTPLSHDMVTTSFTDADDITTSTAAAATNQTTMTTPTAPATSNMSRGDNSTQFQCYSCEGDTCNRPSANVTRCSPKSYDINDVCLMTYDVKKSLRSLSCGTVFPGRSNCTRHLARYSDANTCEYCCKTPLCNLDTPEAELLADCRKQLHLSGVAVSGASVRSTHPDAAVFLVSSVGIVVVVVVEISLLLASVASPGEW